MHRRIGLLVIFSLLPQALFAAFPDSSESVPPKWNGRIFRLSQAYPAALPATDAQPWLAFDPVKQPNEYINALYRYALEGNVESEWEGQSNKIRAWFHAPWMHLGTRGREFIRGLTRERTTPRPQGGANGELGPGQKNCFQNWAVSLFNARAGYQIGQVWRDPTNPNAVASVFPEGSMVVKLLFSTATEAEVPYVKGSLEWDANIHDILASDQDCRAESTRKVQKVRLLQMDLAVKDNRVPVTGWVFATMAFDGNLPGASWTDKLVLVGSQWGNDPSLTAGANPSESWINKAVATPQHLGYQGRLNGPVDNPRSACMSCHATAQVPARSAMTPPPNATPVEIARWFRNLPGDVAFDNRSISTDYSLQIAMGIQNFQIWKAQKGGSFAPPLSAAEINTLSVILAPQPAIGGAEKFNLNGNTVYRIGRD